MRLTEIIDSGRIVLGLYASDKTQVLSDMANKAGAHLKSPASSILAALAARERLGSTGLGHGFALPHVRIAALKNPIGFLIRLARPVDYEAIDGRPVDVLFLMLMPTDQDNQNVAALATVSRIFRRPATLDAIRTASSPAFLMACLTEQASDR